MTSAHGAGRTVRGKLPCPSDVLGVEGLQAHPELGPPHAFGHARSIGFHNAARRTHDVPGAIRIGVGKWVLAQIFFSYARLVGAGVRRWARVHLAGHGYLPKTRLDVERVEAGAYEKLSPTREPHQRRSNFAFLSPWMGRLNRTPAL